MSRIRRTAGDEPFFVVRTLASEAADGHATGRHTHAWGQLVYCASGVMTVWTEDGAWVAPPHWAVWVPHGVLHEIRFVGRCALRTLYLRADLAEGLPGRCGVIGVSPLLRECLLRAVEIGMLDTRDETQAALARLIRAELAGRDARPLELLAPTSAQARRAAELLSDREGRCTVEAAARAVGLSPRALERRFLAETGLPIARWSRQARLLHALRDLAGGASVKAAAHIAGYSTASAFVAAFRAAFGATPGRYFA